MQNQPHRFLHVMLRVADLDTSLTFYKTLFGLCELRRKDYPDGRFTLVFLGYEDEAKETVIELTYNWDATDYQLGNRFGHLAFAVKDIYAFCAVLTEHAIPINRAPAPMKFDSNEIIAFINDPDGYSIELIEKA